jgi:hypothetical protein
MTNFFNKAAFAATVAASALIATPALAAPVSANGTATVKIYSPLTIAAPTATDAVVDFGILVGTLGTRASTNFVIDASTAPTAASVCGAATTWNCSGTPHRATYNITGSVDSSVNVSFGSNSITLLRAGGSPLNADDTVPLGLTLSETADSNGDGQADVLLAGGAATVYVGGTLGVSSTDVDGVYTGSFVVNADYQ